MRCNSYSEIRSIFGGCTGGVAHPANTNKAKLIIKKHLE
jgi:hypothetical protein